MSGAYLQMDELDSLLKEQLDELFVYVLALGSDRELAKDLVQEVLIKFTELTFAGKIIRESARSYLKIMTRNKYYYYKRHEKHGVSLEETGPLPAPPEKDAEKIETISRKVHIVFLEALAAPKLPPEIADVLRRRFVLKQDYNTMCTELNKSRSTVHRMMKSGVSFLQEEFKRAGLDPEELES